ncbi:hypothetical protein SO802_019197, partial [Lithocarpus litseifolius]
MVGSCREEFIMFSGYFSQLASRTVPHVLFWLVVALKNRGKGTVDCLSGIIS